MALPPQLLALLESHLDTIEKLEIVACIRRTKTAATRELVRAALPVPDDMFDDAFEELERAGFVDVAETALRLGPRAAHDHRFALLLDAYDDDRASVMSALSTLALKRIRENASRMLR